MADEPSRTQKEQLKRAQRLHQQIERLKRGQPAPNASKDAEQGGSLREQIESRVAEQKKPTTRDE